MIFLAERHHVHASAADEQGSSAEHIALAALMFATAMPQAPAIANAPADRVRARLRRGISHLVRTGSLSPARSGLVCQRLKWPVPRRHGIKAAASTSLSSDNRT